MNRKEKEIIFISPPGEYLIYLLTRALAQDIQCIVLGGLVNYSHPIDVDYLDLCNFEFPYRTE